MAKKSDNVPDQATITLKNDLVIGQIDQVLGLFRQALKRSVNIVIRADKKISLDLAGIQLLESLRLTCKASGGEAKNDFSLTEESMPLLANSGFDFLLKNSNQQTN